MGVAPVTERSKIKIAAKTDRADQAYWEQKFGR